MMYRTSAPPAVDPLQRCMYCGAGNVIGKPWCSCGVSLPLLAREPHDGPFLCPRCPGQTLQSTAFDPKEYGHHCNSCGGLFVDAQHWTALIGTATEVEVAIIDTSEAPPLSRSQLFPLAACPACRIEMDRAVFAARSGVSVDICSVHGIWLDAGELYAIVHWVTEGCPSTDYAESWTLDPANDLASSFEQAAALLRLRKMLPGR